MAELNNEFAAMIRLYDHRLVQAALAATAIGVGMSVYEGGIPINFNLKRLNYALGHIASPEHRRGFYMPRLEPSPNHPVSMVFETVSPGVFPTAKVSAHMSAPELPGSDGANTSLRSTPDLSSVVGHNVYNITFHATSQQLITPSPTLPTYMASESPTTTTLASDTPAQGASVNGFILGFSVLMVGAVLYCISSCYRTKMKAKADELTNADLIAYMMGQLEEVKAAKLTSEYESAGKQLLINAFISTELRKEDELEGMRKQKRDGDEALRLAQATIARLLKQTTTTSLPEASTPTTERGGDNGAEIGLPAAGEATSSSNGTTTGQPPKPVLAPPPSGELTMINIPMKRRREHWFKHWQEKNLAIVYSNDEVIPLELPCFDARFANIGIARPVAASEEECKKCDNCLEHYAKKDFHDHLKICKAFWGLAVRCGHCSRIFKYNNAFFGSHVPECMKELGDVEVAGCHYTLAEDAWAPIS
jgi:hypothetical protein